MQENTKKSRVIRLAPEDNVVIARRDIPAGTRIPEENITTQSDIPMGHKIASRDIQCGEVVLKHGTPIGRASRSAVGGTHMHNDTIRFDAEDRDYHFCENNPPAEILPVERRRTFMGYVREDGQAGTRNCIAVVTCSNCAATVVRKIAAHFTQEYLRAFPNVDAVTPFIIASGCGIEKSGPPMEYLRRVLGGSIRNPNIAGAVVCALGCESNQIDDFFAAEGLTPGPMLGRVVIQEAGGARRAVEQGIALLEAMLPLANQFVRREVPISRLKVALECGGSDAFSGFSANAALGRSMDLLVRHGGTAVLSEMTELRGMEGVFAARAKTPEVAQKFIDAMRWWLEYSKGRDAQIYGKVTPGNNAGGLTNILEKALGSAQKAGSTPLNGVFDYAETITESGFVIMNAPSYDPLTGVAQFAGGCNLCLFTTGRGSCYGSRYMPTIKIASNTPLYQHQEEDMDLNAGTVIDGTKTLEEVGDEIFEAMIAAASGERTKSELFGMGDDEFIVWWYGITS